MIPWLTENAPFPPVESALNVPNGLLAAGSNLSAQRLLDAYCQGIFPWFNSGDPIMWWSPDPRMVLIPSEIRISRSLAKTLRNSVYEIRFDSAFEQVMRACAAPRGQHDGTWISEEMIAAYGELHRMGYAHSVEVWMPENSLLLQHSKAGELELVGGLYGVAIGRMFYGESMFSKASNTSKIALAHLARQLERWDFGMIDCQMKTLHLTSLGAREIPRSEFVAYLQELVHYAPIINWRFDTDLFA